MAYNLLLQEPKWLGDLSLQLLERTVAHWEVDCMILHTKNTCSVGHIATVLTQAAVPPEILESMICRLQARENAHKFHVLG
jgi:hypothetical protein